MPHVVLENLMRCPTCGVEKPHRCMGALAARHAEAEMIVAAVMRRLATLSSGGVRLQDDTERRVRNYRAVAGSVAKAANFRGRA